MAYLCPNCAFGSLKPIKITYVRPWGKRLITVPNFSAWRCDSCQHTRYDAVALSELEMIIGTDEAEWLQPFEPSSHITEGPGKRGPHRWPF